MREKLPAPVLELLTRLQKAGFEAYPVGGGVRDLLLGRAPHDWDVTTSASPRETEETLAHCRVVETGIRHGTVTVLTGGLAMEITTFRIEGGYSDGRHPDAVHFTKSLTEDLRRRDFTIGAMALDWKADRIIDPYGGEADLKKRVIRAVGTPAERFREDALRILRGLRFAAELGFTVEPETEKAMRETAGGLASISAERVRAELEKLLCGKAAARVLREYSDLVGRVVPEILPMVGFLQHNPHHDKDVWEHTLTVLENIPPEPVLRWAALLHDSGKPQHFTMDAEGVGHFRGHPSTSARMAEEILRRLKCEKRLIRAVADLVAIHDIRFPAEKKLVVRYAGRWGEELFLRFLELRRADTLGQAETGEAETYYRTMKEYYAQAQKERACFSQRDLAVKGEDLMALGLKGRAIGKTLEMLLDLVQRGELPNERAALLEKIGAMT